MSAMGGRFDGLTALDLFSGSGALGLEMLSRGAASVTFVERTRGALRVLEANIDTLGCANRAHVVPMDAHRFLSRQAPTADLAVADPPYASDDARLLVESFLSVPFANELWLEHPFRTSLDLPESSRTRRYGDTAITTLFAPT